MVRSRAAGRKQQRREPCGRKAKGKSKARREEKEAGESNTGLGLGEDARRGQETRSGERGGWGVGW